MLPLKHRAVFCRALALQLAAGAEPVSAAGTAAAALPSRWHPAGERLTTALTRGDSFHGALKAAALLPPSDLALVAIGERSGALDEVLRELADIAEETSARSEGGSRAAALSAPWKESPRVSAVVRR
ncbi:MAG: type II secretion system F family protein, partial [Opitutaceae bacterium]